MNAEHLQRQDDTGPTQDPISASLGLVNDANSIRENIVDEFTCEVRFIVHQMSCYKSMTLCKYVKDIRYKNLEWAKVENGL